MEFDRNILRTIRPIIAKHLEAAAAEISEVLGEKFDIEVGNARYCKHNASLKTEVSTVTADGRVNSKEVENFKRYARSLGLNADDLGKTFTSRGRQFTITGLNIRARTYPIEAKRDDGKGFKFGAATVARHILR